MPPECMLTIEDLDQIEDISSAALYSAEVKRIPFLTAEEQAAATDNARSGDEAAAHQLLHNCLNWVMCQAGVTYRDYSPAHTEVMDLVGHANVKMVEALPNALAASNPVAYLMTVGAREMQRYVTYHDPLIERKRYRPGSGLHPATISLDNGDVADYEQSPAPDIPERQEFAEALSQLSMRHQVVLTAAYGLRGETKRTSEDIALMLNLKKQTVDTYLKRAKRQLAAKLAPYLTELGLQNCRT